MLRLCQSPFIYSTAMYSLQSTSICACSKSQTRTRHCIALLYIIHRRVYARQTSFRYCIGSHDSIEEFEKLYDVSTITIGKFISRQNNIISWSWITMQMQPNIIFSRPHLSLFPSFHVIITGSYRLHRLAFYVEFHTRARLGQVYQTQVRTCMEKQPRSTFIFYSEELLYTAFIYRSLDSN